MLIVNTKSLFVLLILVLSYGCGKKINDGSAENKNYKSTQTFEKNLTLVVNESESITTTYKVPKDALFKLPTELQAKYGNAIGKKIKIFYNLVSPKHYEFQCTYSSTEKDTTFTLVNCESSSGDEIISNSDEISDIWFPVVKGSHVRLQLTNPFGTKMKIESTYLVDWK